MKAGFYAGRRVDVSPKQLKGKCAFARPRVGELKPGVHALHSPPWDGPQVTDKMGEIRLPAHMFLWSLSAIYMFAFASVYLQIPGEIFLLKQNKKIISRNFTLQQEG